MRNNGKISKGSMYHELEFFGISENSQELLEISKRVGINFERDLVAPVVQRLGNFIHQINSYPANSG